MSFAPPATVGKKRNRIRKACEVQNAIRLRFLCRILKKKLPRARIRVIGQNKRETYTVLSPKNGLGLYDDAALGDFLQRALHLQVSETTVAWDPAFFGQEKEAGGADVLDVVLAGGSTDPIVGDESVGRSPFRSFGFRARELFDYFSQGLHIVSVSGSRMNGKGFVGG